MKERIKTALERRQYIADHIDESTASLAEKLGVSKRRVDIYKEDIRKGVTGHKERSQKALEYRTFVLANLKKPTTWIAKKLGISRRAIDFIRKEIDAGRFTKEDAQAFLSGKGKSSGIITPLFPNWLTETVRNKMRLKRPPGSMNALYKAVLASLPRSLKNFEHEVTRTRIHDELEELFWKGNAADIVKDGLNAGYSPEKVYDLLSRHAENLPPRWVVDARIHYMKGLSKAPRETSAFSQPGILRVPIDGAPKRTLSGTSFEQPFHALSESDKERFLFAHISAPQLGLAYEKGNIELNLTRCGIAASRKKRCDALIISGGLFRIIWQKTAGPNRLLTDLVMGTEIDPEAYPISYRKRVLEILESEGSDALDPVYTIAKERFIEVLRGYYKVSMRPTGTPEFNGPVYVVLGPDELGLVRGMTYFELLYRQSQELGQARSEKRLLDKLAGSAHADLLAAELDGDKEKIAVAKQNYEYARKEAAEASEKVNRLRMTNLESAQNRKVYEQALSYLIHEIETSIPGWKIIDQNVAYLRFGKSKHVIKIVSADGSGNAYYDELKGFGPSQRKMGLPSLTIVSHPRAVYMRKTSREDYSDGSMNRAVGFVEAPMLVDAKRIRDQMRGLKPSLPVTKAVADSMFGGGMMFVKVDPEFGVTPDFVSNEAVRLIASPGMRVARPPAKRLWLMVATDLHFGGSMRVPIKRPSGIDTFLTEAVFDLLQKWGIDRQGRAPVAGFFVCDDITHGNHFGTHVRPHYNVRPYAQHSREVEHMLKHFSKDSAVREKELRGMLNASMRQIRYRPPDYLTGQFMELFHGLLRPYVNVFKGIVLAGHSAGVVVKGVSDFAGTEADMRDVGLISFGSGNHATKTTQGMLHEGFIVAEMLRAWLWSHPELAGINLDRVIRSPLYQDQGIAYGTLRVGDGYEWGMHVSGTPPKRDSWYDVLHGWVQVNRQRGNPSSVLNGKAILHLTGDKHFFAGAFAGGDVYVMGPSSTHTDGFAEIAGGLPENNSGVAFVGIPVDGPDAGEISVVHLTREMVEDFTLSGKPFPWQDFLPHSVLHSNGR